MKIQPYLFFNGRCEEAIEFYKKALGAEVIMLMRMKENPEPPPGMMAPDREEKIMHASIRIGNTEVMLSDGLCSGKPDFKGFSLSLAVDTAAQCDKAFVALSEKGKVDMPLTKTFWSSRFGMLTDRFGVQWMVTVTP